MNKLIIIATAALTLGGCVHQPVWNHSNGGRTFAQDQYQCMRENTGYAGGGYVNSYGGGWSSGQQLNGNNYRACMMARGYWLSAPTVR